MQNTKEIFSNLIETLQDGEVFHAGHEVIFKEDLSPESLTEEYAIKLDEGDFSGSPEDYFYYLQSEEAQQQ
jgi:hypothetical protein